MCVVFFFMPFNLVKSLTFQKGKRQFTVEKRFNCNKTVSFSLDFYYMFPENLLCEFYVLFSWNKTETGFKDFKDTFYYLFFFLRCLIKKVQTNTPSRFS